MTNQDFIIRSARKSDLPELSRLATDTFIASFGHVLTKLQLKKLIKQTRSIEYFEKVFDDDEILIAVTEQKIVGYIQFGTIRSPYKNATRDGRELARLYVNSAYHRRGVGKTLLKKALDHPVLHDAEDVYLDIWKSNFIAKNLYQKHGFKVIDEVEWKINGKYLLTYQVMKRTRQI